LDAKGDSIFIETSPDGQATFMSRLAPCKILELQKPYTPPPMSNGKSSRFSIKAKIFYVPKWKRRGDSIYRSTIYMRGSAIARKISHECGA
jgi:hypothetical protein